MHRRIEQLSAELSLLVPNISNTEYDTSTNSQQLKRSGTKIFLNGFLKRKSEGNLISCDYPFWNNYEELVDN